MTTPKIREVSRQPIIAVTAISLLVATLTLHRLDAADVCGANEAIEGVFVQQMVEHGHYLFPLENGQTPMYKPPLFHWTAAALARTAGTERVSPFYLRLPSALYAIGAAAAVTTLAASMLGPEVAILSGLILASSYQFISQARIGRVDMTLAFYETVVLFIFLWWMRRREAALSTGDPLAKTASDWIQYLLAIALGLAVLAKGPVGAVLPLFAIAVYLLLVRSFRVGAALLSPGPVLLALGIGVSWYLACFLGRQMGFLNRQIGTENLGRFFGTLGTMKFSYYLKPILLNSAPFSLLVPVAVVYAIYTLFRGARSSDQGATQPSGERGETTPDAIVLFAIYWVITIAFFWIAAYKRRAYLLPLWPAAAIMLGWFLVAMSRTSVIGSFSRFIPQAAAAVALAVIVFNFVYLPRHEIRQCGDDSMRRAAEQILRVVGTDDPLYFYGRNIELAPLIFYLHRDLPVIEGKLGDAPPGYVLVPAEKWLSLKQDALDLEPVLKTGSGATPLLLLHRGKAYAQFLSARRTPMSSRLIDCGFLPAPSTVLAEVL